MKKVFITVIAGIFMVGSLLLISNSAHAGYFKNRQIRQQKRIYRGVKKDQINRRELYRVEKQQCHIAREKHRMLSDGEFTRREKLKLNHDMNRASRHIFRARHNGR